MRHQANSVPPAAARYTPNTISRLDRLRIRIDDPLPNVQKIEMAIVLELEDTLDRRR